MYSTLNDIKKKLATEHIVALTDDNNTGIIQTDVTDEAILWADSKIDAYLQNKYALPLSSVNAIIRNCSVDFAIHFLYTRRMPENVPGAIQARHNVAEEMLEKIQAGKIVLNADNTAGVQKAFRTNKTADDRRFNKTLWDKFE